MMATGIDEKQKQQKGKGKGRYGSSWQYHLRATGRHLPYGITQCYLPPDTSERTPSNPSHAGWYSIYLRRRDGRLSWPSWLDSAPAGSRTSDLSITSPTPNRCTIKTTKADIKFQQQQQQQQPATSKSKVWGSESELKSWKQNQVQTWVQVRTRVLQIWVRDSPQ